MSAGIILVMSSANGRRCYNVTSSLIGWVNTHNDPWSHGAQFGWVLRYCSLAFHNWNPTSQLHRDIQLFTTLLAFCKRNPLVTSWFPFQRAINKELWCILCCRHGQIVEQTIEMLVKWYTLTLIWVFPNVLILSI